MNNAFVRCRATICSFFAIFLSVFLPDFIYGFINESYMPGWEAKNLTIAILLAVAISFVRPLLIKKIFITIFFLWQSTQLGYYQYFGGFYSGHDIVLMTHEVRDTFLGVADSFLHIMIPVIVSIFFYVVAMGVVSFYHKDTIKIPFLHYVLILAILIPSIQAIQRSSSQRFQPNVTELSVKNGLYSFSYFYIRQIKSIFGYKAALKSYEAYDVSSNNRVSRPNVVILMGESTSYVHMGIFGYERDTTPDLTPYVKSPSFIMIPSLSSAVSTRVSMALFYNVVYEPDNAALVSGMSNSLYKLAKKSGYDTYYISTQKNAGGLTYSLSANDIDYWRDDRHLDSTDGEHDYRLLKELKRLNLDYSKPNFITLHMRSAHGPYIDNYPRSEAKYPDENVGYHDYMINTYDNSILYTQKIIAEIYEYFDSIDEPVYIFFVPDHSEVLGIDGRYGHNTLYLDNAKVPFLFYGANVPVEDVETLRKNLGCLTNHYLTGKQIASYLGFDINNPNEVEDVFYMNGIDAFGEAGYLQYSLSEQREELCLK